MLSLKALLMAQNSDEHSYGKQLRRAPLFQTYKKKKTHELK